MPTMATIRPMEVAGRPAPTQATATTADSSAAAATTALATMAHLTVAMAETAATEGPTRGTVVRPVATMGIIITIITTTNNSRAA